MKAAMDMSVRRVLISFVGGFCALAATAMLLSEGAASIRGREPTVPDFALEIPDDSGEGNDDGASVFDDVPAHPSAGADAILSTPLAPPETATGG